MRIELKKQLFITNEAMTSSDWISLCEFDVEGDIMNFNILDFFKSKHYSSDFLNCRIKELKEDDLPKPLFKADKLRMNDFKLYNSSDLNDFLLCYTSDIDIWGQNFNKNFKEIYHKLKPNLNSLSTYYLLDKEDFNLDSVQVTGNFLFYDYYILFVWVDEVKHTFNTCEWASD